MADIANTVESLRRFQVLFQGLSDVVTVLDEIGPLQGAAQEARNAYSQALTDKQAALDDLDKAKEDTKAERAKAKALLADATEKAEKMAADSLDASTKIRDNVQSEVNKLIAQGKAKADAIDAKAAAAKADADAALADYAQKTQQAELDYATAIADLGVVEAKISAAREQISKMLG